MKKRKKRTTSRSKVNDDGGSAYVYAVTAYL